MRWIWFASALTVVAGPPEIKLPSARVSIPIALYGDRPTIELKLNGAGPYAFIVDTGASGNVVDDSIAPKDIHQATFEFGGIIAAGLRFETAPFKRMFRGAENTPAGVLSASAFPGYLVTFDYPHATLVIERGALPVADGRAIFSYPEGDLLPTIPVTIAGRKYHPHLDTGSPGGLTVPLAAAEDLGVKDKLVQRGRAATPHATFDIFTAPVAGEIRIGDFKLEVLQVTFSDLNPGLRPVGNIGYRDLHRFAVTLDSRNRRIRLAE